MDKVSAIFRCHNSIMTLKNIKRRTAPLNQQLNVTLSILRSARAPISEWTKSSLSTELSIDPLCLRSSSVHRHHAVPAPRPVQMNVELIENAHDDVIDDVIDRLRVVVEGRHRRQDRHAHA